MHEFFCSVIEAKGPTARLDQSQQESPTHQQQVSSLLFRPSPVRAAVLFSSYSPSLSAKASQWTAVQQLCYSSSSAWCQHKACVNINERHPLYVQGSLWLQ